MISITISISDISTVTSVFNSVQLRKWTGTGVPDYTVTDAMALNEYVTVSSGIDTINNRINVSDVSLNTQYSQYYFTDPDGYNTDWYISRYYNTTTYATSGWSIPIQGEPGDLYYNPVFPLEVEYDSADQLIIDRIRLWIGDSLNIRREYGEDALSSIHPDGKTYELDQKGWPIYINMGGVQYITINNPSVNGYKFLRFDSYIDDVCTECVTYSGICGEDIVKEVTQGVDIWYHTFRFSDKQIMYAYDNCPPPSPLTVSTATSEAYMLQTAIDLLRSELIEDSTDDGAIVKDDKTYYDPTKGLALKKTMLDDLQKRLNDLIKTVMLSGITGVLID